MAIVHNGEPCVVTDATHSKQGRAGAVVRAKLKNLATGSVVEKTFHGNEKVEPADVAYQRAQFLYKDEIGAHFMDQSYEQFSLGYLVVEASLGYLKEGEAVDDVFFVKFKKGIEQYKNGFSFSNIKIT